MTPIPTNPTQSGSIWRPWRPWDPTVCHICNRSFCRQGELKRHQDSKHAKKTRKCIICEKKFTRKDNLTRHIKSKHGGVGKPRCRFCQKPLSRKDSASRHQRTCHRNPARQVAPSPPTLPQMNRRANVSVIVRIGRREGSVNSECSDDSRSSCSSA